MAVQRTLCIAKPDSVARGVQGAIFQRLQEEGFKIVAMRQLQMSRAVAEGFYAVHKDRPFFDELCTFMSRSPVVVAALERENAVQHYRDVIGATDPAKAADGSIRKLYGTNVGENAVHGSDSEENGIKECAYFFPGYDLL